MKTKPITYLAAALALAVAGSSCDHDEIYEPLDFAVRLAPTNTYRVGEPVVFNFEGNADYITFWSGDVGHEYRYRDRTTVAIENIESCELSFGLAQAYGQTDTDTRYCDILVTDQFAGLSGSDATADGALVAAIDDQHTGWTEIPYENLSNRTSLVNVPKVNYTYDITPYAGNFCLALHFHHGENQNMRSFAFNNLRITVQFDGYDPAEYTFDDLSFVSYSTIEQHADNPYVHNVSGDGYVKLAGENGSNPAGEIVYQGYNWSNHSYVSDQWLFLRPMALNAISPDTGLSIKGVTDDVKSYSYTYNKPGTYTATFLVGTGNYQGESGIQTYEVTFTVIDPIE